VGDDVKYGRITTERKDIPDDEPVILFRGQDIFTPQVALAYLAILEKNNLGQTPLAGLMRRGLARVQQWQGEHPDRIKIPD